MELIRKILFTIEEQYKPGGGAILKLKIDNYEMRTIAEHCDLLFQQGFVKSYQAFYGDNTIQGFAVGNISSSGYDYLELIRSNNIWEKTKQEIDNNNIPQTFETIAKIAGVFIGNVIKEING